MRENGALRRNFRSLVIQTPRLIWCVLRMFILTFKAKIKKLFHFYSPMTRTARSRFAFYELVAGTCSFSTTRVVIKLIFSPTTCDYYMLSLITYAAIGLALQFLPLVYFTHSIFKRDPVSSDVGGWCVLRIFISKFKAKKPFLFPHDEKSSVPFGCRRTSRLVLPRLEKISPT